MALTRAGGYGHQIHRLGENDYRISWTYDTKSARLRWPRRVSRDTDRAGAERFAKRWGIVCP